MKIFGAEMPPVLIDFFGEILKKTDDFEDVNKNLKRISGIKDFFRNNKELAELKNSIADSISVFKEPKRRAYGDFQTNGNLAKKVVKYVSEGYSGPQFVFEPTCGKGIFILAALRQFSQIEKIVGIEIFAPYVWETKFRVLELILKNENKCTPEIEIIQADIFSYNLEELSRNHRHLKTLVIGNPPWVTNSELSTLNSNNLPSKSNFKNHNGLDAITGKGNFDIGEFITLQILTCFDKCEGAFTFLVKSIVVKNIMQHQKKTNFQIGNIRKLNIDAKKEFNVSVDACLFQVNFQSLIEYTCQELDFYTQTEITELGWYSDKFVYSINDYISVEEIDGKSTFVWRQGMKHDCSKIMELDCINGHFVNGFKEELYPENDLIYGILKSSDLKNEIVTSHRKSTIVTQKKVGQDTKYIKESFPLTYAYLNQNRAYFDKRKSSIYRGKPPFSIFGIGSYSFAKYKVAISGMYKRTIFSLVLPDNNKPLMLDDTCYFIGFETIEEAKVAQEILNSNIVQSFLKSIIFPNAKRPVTKDILMRIDMERAYNILFSTTNKSCDKGWIDFGNKFKKFDERQNQMTLF